MKTMEAVGLVEALGAASATKVVDQMLKTSAVTFEAWRSECGGQVTIFMSGNISAVTAAVDSIRKNPPCEIINSAVMSRPSEETIRMIERARVAFKEQMGFA